jgi:hypothetical protein
MLRNIAHCCHLIRDPGLAVALQGAAELAAIPETPELKAVDGVIVRPENG